DNDDILLTSGAGMLNDAGSPTVLNCTFRKNTTWTSYGASGFDDGNFSLESTYIYLPETSGAAVFNRGGSPTFQNCVFEENVCFGADASSAGAGVCNINGNPLLDGCVFRANVVTGFDNEYYGGAMANYGSSPRIRRCSFFENMAEFSYGGAIYSEESNPVLTDCMFRGNEAGHGAGGAMFIYWSDSTLTNCMFENREGGGIKSDFRSSLTVKECTFIGNSADLTGGAIENSGAWFNDPNSITLISDCVFTANSASRGGGIQNGWNRKNLSIVNCIFAGNASTSAGGGIYNYGCEQILSNCTFAGNSALEGEALASDLLNWQETPSNLQISNCIFRNGENGILNSENTIIAITYSDVEGGWPGEGNIDVDPLFVEPGYWDVNDVWVDGDYHLLPGSACIDAGDSSAVPPSVTTDLDGNLRIRGQAVDMGVYESLAVYFVDIDAEGANNGSSWADAFQRIEDALEVAQASNPKPADGATGVGITTDLSWITGSGAMSHDVYFGTVSPGVFQGNQVGTTFDPGTMTSGIKYYWRIDEVSTWDTTTGEVWSFTTDPGPPPSMPSVVATSSASEISIMDHCRFATFVLKNGVIMKGCYAGFGEPDPDARDIDAYKTVLSGDMNGDDVEVNDPCDLLTDPSRADNCYHVVTSRWIEPYGPNTVLDGFTITGGNADGQYPDWELGEGGGMYNR
ncbi:MAG: right-handed parallel beta-helix repeat-containing protein, partial [Planctomycetota bacterium]